MAGKFSHRTTMRYPDSPLTHLDGWEFLPNGSLSCAPFLMGSWKVPYLARFKKGAQECMNWRTIMAPPEASAVGSVLGAGVGRHDVFHWERILASFIQLLSLPTSITSTPSSSMVMTRHIHDLRMGLPSLLDSDGVSRGDGDSDGSGDSGKNGITVSVVLL
jgi:hypothetical protein